VARIADDTPDGNRQIDLVHAVKQAQQREVAPGKPRTGAAGPVKRQPQDIQSEQRIQVRRELISRNDPAALERLIGKRDIVSINFFLRGLRAAKAVCRIKTLGSAGGPPDYATGFLAAPSLLVTNHHVLPDPETASRSLAEFENELDINFVERRGRIFPLQPIEAFYTDATLDFTIVAISPTGHDGTPIADFGVLPMLPMSGKALPGEHVSIIQHPEGGTKQVVVRENRLIALDAARFPSIGDAFVHYTADTERGSSGAPVFNDQWDLVAIHHMAIADRDTEGRTLNRNGQVWSEADGDDAKKWIANEGLRVSALMACLREAAAFDTEAARIMAMLAFEPRAMTRLKLTEAGTAPQRWQTIPNAPELPAFESTRFADPAFKSSQGYDPGFLGTGLNVPLPKTGPGFRGTLATNSETGKTVFDYTHFSLAMVVERRLAVWTAVNIDGKSLKSSDAEPGWRRDPRLPANQQTLAEVYGKAAGKGVQIDRGHLVRRLDPVWGTQAVADRAAADTFHYSNAAPQEHVYNSETWGNLEDFVLARADQRDHKVSVMTGPVLRPDDDFYGEGLKGGPWQIPWSFWKIAVFKRPDGTPSVTGFIVEQRPTIAPLFESTRYNPYTVEQARVFQRPIAMIEELTGLDFGKLRSLDRMGSVESTAMPDHPIRGAADIIF
jgi:endonuclease G